MILLGHSPSLCECGNSVISTKFLNKRIVVSVICSALLWDSQKDLGLIIPFVRYAQCTIYFDRLLSHKKNTCETNWLLKNELYGMYRKKIFCLLFSPIFWVNPKEREEYRKLLLCFGNKNSCRSRENWTIKWRTMLSIGIVQVIQSVYLPVYNHT